MREELEAALARDFSRANLTVYADYLQSIGDPRGDWIAMDLALLRDGARAATQEAREAVLRRYHGYVERGRRHRYGFLDELEMTRSSDGTGPPWFDFLGNAIPVLAGHVGPYIRAIRLAASLETVAHVVEKIAAIPRPWLHRITLDLAASTKGIDLADTLPGELRDRLAAATPALRFLELGPATLSGFTYAAVVERCERTTFTRAIVEVPGEPAQHVELGRLERHHAGTVDDMDATARDAWADLRLCLAYAEDGRGGPAQVAFPAATLRTVIASIDLGSFFGKDWAVTADQLARHPGCDTVMIGRM